MTFRQSLGIILGADIGTTLTVQLLAFNLRDLALLLVAAGFALSFFGRRGLVRRTSARPCWASALFLGMRLMTDGIAPMAEHPLARQVLVAFASNPPVGALAGALLSAGMASSAATIGVLLSLAHQGLLPLDGALPVVLGANVGTCAIALAASLRSTSDARRVAVAHIAFKVLGVALVFPFIQPLTALVAETAADPARQIANAHTLFNVAISALFLPFAPLAARAITALVPEQERGDNPFKTRYLDERYLDQPSLALGQSHPRSPPHGGRGPEHASGRARGPPPRRPGAPRGGRAPRRSARLPRARDQALPRATGPRDHEPGHGQPRDRAHLLHRKSRKCRRHRGQELDGAGAQEALPGPALLGGGRARAHRVPRDGVQEPGACHRRLRLPRTARSPRRCSTSAR